MNSGYADFVQFCPFLSLLKNDCDYANQNNLSKRDYTIKKRF